MPVLYLYGDIIPFFSQGGEFSKNANSASWFGELFLFNLFFAPGQLEFAFFGAATPVAALFNLSGRKKAAV